MSKHNVVPNGRTGTYTCACGATFGKLTDLTAHITRERNQEHLRASDRLFARAVRLVLRVEAIMAGRHS